MHLKRNHPRRYHEQPIQYTDPVTGSVCKANLYNSSNEGLYFESVAALEPGQKLLIRIQNRSPDPDISPEAFIVMPVDVVWCREVKSNHVSRFGTGVRFR